MSRAERFDVVVIGGGPAGLAAALAAQAQGLSVVVIEANVGVLDKACGEGLMPNAIAALTELGVSLEGIGRPFRGIRYIDGTSSARGGFPGAAGRGLRRTQLHSRLRETVSRQNIQLLEGERVVELGPLNVATQTSIVQTQRRNLEGQWIVGADGLHSRVRRWSGLSAKETSKRRRTPLLKNRRLGLRRHFKLTPWSQEVEVYWAEGAEAYVTPISANEVGVAFLWRGHGATFDRMLARFPKLAHRIAGAQMTSETRGSGPLRQKALAVQKHNVALIGDASGYVDAITGEGLAIAFEQALQLGQALAKQDLLSYQKASSRLRRLPDVITHLLLSIEQRPRLRRRLISTLAAEPQLFDRLLAIHARQARWPHLGLVGAFKLTSGLLRAA